MTVGAISSGSIGLIDGVVPTQDAAKTTTQSQEFTRSFAAVTEPSASQSQSSGAVPPAEPQREINRAATRNDSLGERILDRLEAVHRGDRLSNGDKNVSSGPVVKAASVEPGPAASALRELPGGPGLNAKAPHNGSGQFRNMLEQLQQTYGQVIQVSVVSKSSGSFTSSMNRLMSST
jgi:hypothetical protein